MIEPTPEKLSVIYYTSNYLEEKNPYFLKNTKKQLIKAIDDLPLVVVSQKHLGFDDILFEKKGVPTLEYCIGDIGKSHTNIYLQILEGARLAKTPFVAMAEDDILYSWEHYHSRLPKRDDVFLYDMNRLSILTWNKPPLYSYRYKRTVVNQLIAPRQMLIDALEERFALLKNDPNLPLKYWGDPGRYEDILGITRRKLDTFMCTNPSIVFSHEWAYGK